jgi:hypothetical protein
MKKYLRLIVCIGIVAALSCAFAINSWASPFEYIYPYWHDTTLVDVGYYAEIGVGWDHFTGTIPAEGWLSAYDYFPLVAIDSTMPPNERRGWVTWEMRYQITEFGFSILSDMTLTTVFSQSPELQNPGYAYAMSGLGSYVYDSLLLSATSHNPAGVVIPFIIQVETFGTPWEKCEWELEFGGVTVNQDSYDLVVFNLIAGEEYSFKFEPGAGDFFHRLGGFQTQSLVEGSLESGFQLNFVQLHPVPIPGAIWLLGSGLVGVIGLKRKYLT